MQTSVFKIPTIPDMTGNNTIGDINQLDLYGFEKQLLVVPVDSTELVTNIDGKPNESFNEDSLGDMMELQQNHQLHTLWEEEYKQDMKVWDQRENSFMDMISTEPVEEKYFPGFLMLDGIDNKITDKDRMEFKLSHSYNTTTEDYAEVFFKVGHISLLVENNKTYIGFVTVDNIIKNLVKHMVMVNEGLCHMWTYRERECYAILDWAGCWNLYAIAPMEYVDDARPHAYSDPHTNFLAWDENNNLYKVLLDLTTDVMLPNSETDEARPGSTFKDLSYCKAYVNMFVDGIRRGN
jgi:hypothetical protein